MFYQIAYPLSCVEEASVSERKEDRDSVSYTDSVILRYVINFSVS
jgi:hypothetical protein